MIIAFGHRKQQGKDTAVNILYNHIRNTFRYGSREPQPNSFKVSFAEPLYEVCELMIPEFFTKLYYDLNPFEKEVVIPRLGKTPRDILIHIGQRFKEVLGSDCFARCLMNAVQQGNEHDVYLISDLRFPVEFEAIKEAGGICVKVIRPGIEVSRDDVDDALAVWEGWDYELVNDGTLEDFKKKVIDLYEEIKRNQS